MRIDFIKNLVIYTSVDKGAAFSSIHDRTGLTNDQASKHFLYDHVKEVAFLMQQRTVNENSGNEGREIKDLNKIVDKADALSDSQPKKIITDTTPVLDIKTRFNPHLKNRK